MSTASTIEWEMLALINQERESRGLDPLLMETQLNDSSEDHSAWMLDTDRFSHTGEDGSSATQRMRAAGFDFEGSWRSGENIAWQSERGAPGISDDVAQLHENLMSSPGHRANILNPDFRYIGIGIETGDMRGYDAVMVTQNFATTSAPVLLDQGLAFVEPIPTQPAEESLQPVEEETVEPIEDDYQTAEEVTAEPVEEIDPPTQETVVTPVEDNDETVEEIVAEPDGSEYEKIEEEIAEPVESGEKPVEENVAEPLESRDETVSEDIVEPVESKDEPYEKAVVESDVTDIKEFDVQAFLVEVEEMVNTLKARFDQFDWNKSKWAQPESKPNDFDFAFSLGSDEEETFAEEEGAIDESSQDFDCTAAYEVNWAFDFG
ncbi:CAP domain-containing protein [Ruegeria arenilitoris]|uniref:CAP domain-containing protein n=1 Tax=Ruegeria arenilitoris TaxID=1173585 RepID=UPI00147C5576|nr:CAP domain-containing protein [Ruegeria arenilitoris]